MSPQPDRLAWFAHRRDGSRHLGVFDPSDGCFDLGPLDELTALADGRLLDLRALRAKAGEAIPDPVFDVPVAAPSKILCLGKNYAAHAAEFGAEVPEEPIVFTKLRDTLLPHGAPIVLPHWVETRIDHELELGVILGFTDPQRRGRKYVAAEHALELVGGYTILNDVTARRMQGDDRAKQHPWLRCKSFDTFCPIGPWVVPRTELPEANALELWLEVDGAERQRSNTSLMVTGIAEAIAFLSRHTTLRPGDVIATGTPAGVGPLQPGNVVRCVIEHLGVLANPVIREPQPD